jgi:hypothetical protein
VPLERQLQLRTLDRGNSAHPVNITEKSSVKKTLASPDRESALAGFHDRFGAS